MNINQSPIQDGFNANRRGLIDLDRLFDIFVIMLCQPNQKLTQLYLLISCPAR